MTDTPEQSGLPDGSDSDHRHDCRAQVDIDCQVRIANLAWRKAQLADLTPEGFQITIFDMPARGTQVYIRFAGIQMHHAEVCWAKADKAGCRFLTPISPYVFDHILANCG